MNQPCKQCPYRKDSLKGYLGESSYNPQEFLKQLEYTAHPCHLTVDWDNNNFKEAKMCVGAMQFMNNSCMMAKDSSTAALQKTFGKNDEVLSFKHNFIEHHS